MSQVSYTGSWNDQLHLKTLFCNMENECEVVKNEYGEINQTIAIDWEPSCELGQFNGQSEREIQGVNLEDFLLDQTEGHSERLLYA